MRTRLHDRLNFAHLTRHIMIAILIMVISGLTIAQSSEGAIVSIPVHGQLLFGGFSDNDTSHLWIVDTFTGQTETPITDSYRIEFPTWSSDANQVSYLYSPSIYRENIVYDLITAQAQPTLRDEDTRTYTIPVGWSADNTNIMYAKRHGGPDDPVYTFVLYDLATNTATDVRTIEMGETLSELPPVDGRAGFRIGLQELAYEIERNPVYDAWVAMLSNGTDVVHVPDPTNELGFQVLSDVILWNFQTGQMLSAAGVVEGEIEISKPIGWSIDGKQLVVHTSGEHYGANILTLQNPMGDASLKFLELGDPEGSVTHWLGAGNLLISEEYEMSTKDIVFHISEIVDGEMFSTEFIRLPHAVFPSAGQTDWRITASEEEKRTLTCIFDQTLAPRLEVGEDGRVAVNDGTPRELRSEPGTDKDIIAQMSEGTVFDVIGEPWCANGYRWWQIQLADDTIGYAAEADTSVYFLENVD